ncbi:MAG: MATE family efflux transporter [Christensenellaceae bacterium]|nr:MATE family efflux transporter [Christensenellaceae bacterium]
MKIDKTELFSNMPVKRAVILQILPAVASQMVALIYGLADTYFVGMLNNPDQTAAVTVSNAAFLMLTALSNLFGIGGASLIARSLGIKRHDRAKQVSSFCFWSALISAAVFSGIVAIFNSQILHLCGARGRTLTYATGYAFYALILGAVPTVMNTMFANLVRAEGEAANASIGVTIGCVINIILDPIFVLPWGFNMGAAGAGAATAISNLIGMGYFLVYIARKGDGTVINIHPRELSHAREHAGEVFKIGFPSALQYALTVVAVSAQMNFVSKYSNAAVAGLGITKKLDQLPLYFSIGVANGLLPLIGYNYAAKNYERTESAFKFGCMLSLGFAVICVVLYETLANTLAGLFIGDTQTVEYAASFLRRMVLAMPFMSVCYPMIIKFQAMGKAKESLTVSIMRKGVLDIPLYFLMDALMPLYGCMWVQPIVDTLSLSVAVILNRRITKLDREAQQIESKA